MHTPSYMAGSTGSTTPAPAMQHPLGMDENRANHAANRLAFWGALSASIGILLSGPLSLLLTMALAPQPPWQGPVVFAQHFHPLQQLAYLFGFPLIGGFVVLHAALPDTVAPARRPLARVALVITAVFASFICFNYVAQLAVVPALRHDDPPSPLVAALSMANPRSLCWALEMFGYGFLGVASLFIAPCFGATRLERAARWLLIGNGVMSVAGAAFTAVSMTWLMKPVGLVLYSAWNALVLAMTIVLTVVFSSRLRRPALRRPLSAAS